MTRKNVIRASKLSLCALLCSVSFTARAGQMTVGDLHELCSSPDDDSKRACTFYILGVAEGAGLADSLGRTDSRLCVPEGVSSSQVEFVVKESIGHDLVLYPKDRELPAVSMVMAVMMHAYPCSKAE